MIGSLFSRREKSVAGAAAILMFSLFLSDLLGLLKLHLLSRFFGASAELGIFLAADRLPSFIFNLFIFGSLSSSFIPIFSHYLARDEEETAFKFSSILMNLTFLFFLVFSIFFFLFTPQLSSLLAVGKLESAELDLMVRLTRLLLVSQLFLTASLFATSILQSLDRFLIPSLAPIFYNLGSVLGIFLFAPTLGIYGAALGVVLGSLLHLVVQLPNLSQVGFRYFFDFDFREKPIREAIHLIIPRTIGLAIDQVNFLIDTVLSFSLSASSVVILSFAQRLEYFPVVLFGSTIAQASLPTLSKLSSKGVAGPEYKEVLVKSLHQILYLTLPVSILLLVLRLPAVRMVFGTKRFDWYATNLTGYTLAFFSLGIFSQSLGTLFARAFYALKDTKTPLIIGFGSVFVNVSLSILLVIFWHLNVWALALSASLSSWLNSILLFVFLEKKIGRLPRSELLGPITKMGFSGLVMGVFIYLPLKILDQGGWGSFFPYTLSTVLFDTRYTVNLFLLTLVSSLSGLIFYLSLTSYLKVSEGRRIITLLSRVRDLGRYVFPSIFQE